VGALHLVLHVAVLPGLLLPRAWLLVPFIQDHLVLMELPANNTARRYQVRVVTCSVTMAKCWRVYALERLAVPIHLHLYLTSSVVLVCMK